MVDSGTRRVVAVVQARMTSTRLPGKVLSRLNGRTTLELVLERLGRATGIAEVVVATSTASSDDPVAAAAEQAGRRAIRGSLDDVLERYLLAARITDAAAVVRVTADCPLVSPEIVDRIVDLWTETGADFVANTVPPRSFPDGLDVELVTVPALEQAAAAAHDPADREHVTSFLQAHPDVFTSAGLWLAPACGQDRVTLDTPRDLRFLRTLIDRIGDDAPLDRIIEALGRAPAKVTTEPA